MNTNTDIRKTMREKRKALTESQKKTAANNCLPHFLTFPHLSKLQQFACYQAFDGEMDPAYLIELLFQQKKSCYLPVISKNHDLHFYPYFPDTRLIKNQYHILEPIHDESILEKAIPELDLILLPCVAFDHDGNRLGMGKGYYDKTLYETIKNRKKQKPFLLGFAYDFQRVEKILTHEKDVKLDGVLTEKELVLFSEPRA